MKLFLKLLGGAVVLLILAFAVIYFSLNIIIARAITTLGPEATQTPVTVSSVSVSPLTGLCTIDGLTINSPKNFTSQPAIKVGQITIQIDPASLLGKKILIKKVVIDSPEVNFEQTFSGNNIGTIRHNLDTYTAHLTGSGGSSSGHKFEIDRLVIKSGKVKVNTSGAQVLIPLSDVDRSNLGSSDAGMTSAEVVKVVFSTFSDTTLKDVASGALIKEGAKSIGEGIKRLFQ